MTVDLEKLRINRTRNEMARSHTGEVVAGAAVAALLGCSVYRSRTGGEPKAGVIDCGRRAQT